MDIMKLSALALLGGAFGILLKQYKPEYGFAVGIFTSLTILGVAVPYMQASLQFITAMTGSGEVSLHLVPIFKALGIALVVGIAADICRDFGESAIASKLELAGRMAILMLTLPLAGELIILIKRVLG